jgi:hypothetical protein
MTRTATEQIITGLTLRQVSGKSCVCCGKDYPPPGRSGRVHVGMSESGQKVYACRTCPGADRPSTLRQPWCRADQRPSLSVMRHDNGMQVAHAKIVRDGYGPSVTPLARALIYFNPNSAKAWDVTAVQIRQLGDWFLNLAGEVARINRDTAPQETARDRASRTVRSGNVRSLEDAREKDHRRLSSRVIDPQPVDDAEAALVERATAAFLDLEKRFGTRAFHIADHLRSRHGTEYTARANAAVPEVVENMMRMLKEIGMAPGRPPTAEPFPAPHS